jgi:hypothetical protein
MSDDPPGPLLEALAQRDKRLRQAKADLARSSVPTQSLGETLDSLEFETRQRLRDLELSFSQLGEHARATLKLLTDGERVRFIPRNGIYRVEGSLAVPCLFRLGTAAADCIVTPTGNNTVGSALAAATAFRLQFVA